MLDQADQVLQPIVDDKNLSAIEKLRLYFDTSGRWKVAQKTFMLELLRVWRTDANALMRQKQQAAAMKRIAPVLAQIIRQGIAEGVFSTKYPEQFGSMLVGLSRGFEDSVADLLLADIPPPNALEQLEDAVGAYSDSLERILGAPAGSLPLGDISNLKEWLSAK
jgi:hypothetical protein